MNQSIHPFNLSTIYGSMLYIQAVCLECKKANAIPTAEESRATEDSGHGEGLFQHGCVCTHLGRHRQCSGAWTLKWGQVLRGGHLSWVCRKEEGCGGGTFQVEEPHLGGAQVPGQAGSMPEQPCLVCKTQGVNTESESGRALHGRGIRS